jgi:hypothetical protein
MDKSYVALERNVCTVCGKEFDTGNLLLDRRLRNRFDMHTLTGWGLCPDHQKLYDDGYIALVGVDPSKSGPHNETMKPEDAYRTGEVAHVRFHVFEGMFSTKIEERDGHKLPMVFVEQAVIDKLKERVSG